jgi:D-tyrosyl-tRNA(Tyr) deacylase
MLQQETCACADGGGHECVGVRELIIKAASQHSSDEEQPSGTMPGMHGTPGESVTMSTEPSQLTVVVVTSSTARRWADRPTTPSSASAASAAARTPTSVRRAPSSAVEAMPKWRAAVAE